MSEEMNQSVNSLFVNVGQVLKLDAEVIDTRGSVSTYIVKWESNDLNIEAEGNTCTIVPIKVGECKVKAISEGIEREINIIVEPPKPKRINIKYAIR